MADFYIDFSAANDGDGTAFGQAASGGATGAYNTLAGKTFTTGDKVWMRRVTRGSNYTSTITLGVSGVLYIGWPMSGDTYYSTRPSGAQGTWDADGNSYAKFSFASSVNLATGATNLEFHRLHVLQTVGSQPMISYGSFAGTKHYNCIFENSGTMSVTGLTVNSSMTGTIYDGCEFRVANFASGGSTYVINCNVTAVFLTNATFTVTTTSPSGTAYIINLSSTAAYLADIAVNIATLAGSTGLGLITMGSSNTVINVLGTVTTHSASASIRGIEITGSGNILRNVGTNFGNGLLCSGNANDIEITSLTQRHLLTAGSVLISGTSNVVAINNAIFVTGNTTGDVVVSGVGNVIAMRNAAYQNATPCVVTSAGTKSKIISFDHNATADDLRMFWYQGSIESSTTYRTGGESYSLKLTNSLSGSQSRGDLQISPVAAESMWLSLPSGANTITIYGAHKNFSTITAADIWAELQYKDGSDVIQTLTTFNYAAALTSDSSTWNNDSGLTLFKLVLSVTLPSAQVCPVRILGSKYTASAYAYIDPLPVIT